MNVWLLTTHEPVRIDGANTRLLRTGIFAEFLVKAGHNVLWWQSTFNHAELSHRFTEKKTMSIMGASVIFLKSNGYKQNISLGRVIDHFQVAKSFSKAAAQFPKPDILVCSFPPFSHSERALDYGKKNNIPVLIDYRDMWPEAFINAMPQRFQGIGYRLLQPMFRKAHNIFQRATGIVTITEPFLDIALEKIGRTKTNFDIVIPLGYKKNELAIPESITDFWKKIGIEPNKSFYVCFFGKIGHQFELDTVINAAKIIAGRKLNITFVFCGNGDRLDYFKMKAADTPNIIFSGYINSEQIQSLMQMSPVGVAPYFCTLDFNSSLPNKAFEYMSEGLTIVTSLKDGYLGKFLKDNNMGYAYSNGNPKELADLLIELLEKKEQLELNRSKIKEIFESKFKSDIVYGTYMMHLEKTVKAFNEMT